MAVRRAALLVLAGAVNGHVLGHHPGTYLDTGSTVVRVGIQNNVIGRFPGIHQAHTAAAFKKQAGSAFHIRSRRIEISRFLGVQLSVLIRPVHIIGQDAHDAAIVVHGGCHVILSVLVGLLGHFPAAPGHGNAAVVQHVIFHSRLQAVAVAPRRGNLGFFHHAVHHRHGDAGQRQDNGDHHKQFN